MTTTFTEEEIKAILKYWKLKIRANLHENTETPSPQAIANDITADDLDIAADDYEEQQKALAAELASEFPNVVSPEEFFDDGDSASLTEKKTEKKDVRDDGKPGSAKYAPNTVGAVIELLKKSDLNNKLELVDAQGKPYFLTDIKHTARNSNNVTTVEIVAGSLEDDK